MKYIIQDTDNVMYKILLKGGVWSLARIPDNIVMIITRIGDTKEPKSILENDIRNVQGKIIIAIEIVPDNTKGRMNKIIKSKPIVHAWRTKWLGITQEQLY